MQCTATRLELVRADRQQILVPRYRAELCRIGRQIQQLLVMQHCHLCAECETLRRDGFESNSHPLCGMWTRSWPLRSAPSTILGFTTLSLPCNYSCQGSNTMLRRFYRYDT